MKEKSATRALRRLLAIVLAAALLTGLPLPGSQGAAALSASGSEEAAMSIYRNDPASYLLWLSEARAYPEAMFSSAGFANDLAYRNYAFMSDPLCGYIYNYRYTPSHDPAGNLWVNKTAASDRAKIYSGKAVLDRIKVTGTDYEKAWKLYCRVGKLISYRTESGNFNYKSIYAARTGFGDCQGYAKCYKYLCDRNGVPCETVWSNDHMWNIVKIKGKWYNVDCTAYCEESDNDTNREWFLLSDKKTKSAFGEKAIVRKEVCRSSYPKTGRPKKLRCRASKGRVKVSWKAANNTDGVYRIAWKYKGDSRYRTRQVKRRSFTIRTRKNRRLYVKVRSREGLYTEIKAVNTK